jgi:hypothetical protein
MQLYLLAQPPLKANAVVLYSAFAGGPNRTPIHSAASTAYDSVAI